MNDNKLPKIAFLLSCTILVFGYGIAVGRYQLFPFYALKFAQDAIDQVFQEREMITGLRPTAHLRPARYSGEGVTRFEVDRATPGLTLISGFSDEPDIRLVRSDGSLLHRWYVPFSEAFPDPSHLPMFDIPKTDWNIQLHGALALPDGSVVFNFEYLGLVKLDRCSQVEWSVPVMAHHSIELSEDGGFWVPGRQFVESASAFLPIEAPYLEDTILKISPNGQVLSEVSIVKLLYEDPLLRSVFLANGLDAIEQRFFWRSGVVELVHLNDIEELSSDLADHFPQFNAGDLLVSLRNHHLIMVLDPVTYAIKWYQVGPWMRQHDPDFTQRGTITVFNNNTDNTDTGTVFGGSDIMEIDPVSRETKVKYGAEADQHWYSEEKGKHQILGDAGEHILITDSSAGRVLEVDNEGRIVWEFIDRFDDQDVAQVTQAIRYPEDYFLVDDWSCQ